MAHFRKLIFTGVWLTYSVVLVSGGQHCDFSHHGRVSPILELDARGSMS